MSIFRKSRKAGLCLAVILMGIATAQAQPTAAAPAPATQSTAEVDTTFRRWDKNADGALSAAEFGAGWQEIQAANTLRNLHENFLAKDVDRDGALDSPEYLKLDLVRKAGASAPAMATFDIDRSQTLDFKEYVALVGVLIKSTP